MPHFTITTEAHHIHNTITLCVHHGILLAATSWAQVPKPLGWHGQSLKQTLVGSLQVQTQTLAK
eukprot:m.275459 g.275459  ORF g.275459 m.275459 type:complete len:64 (+) comp15696_c2_seq1:2568-2759(+)